MANGLAAALTAEKVGVIRLSGKEGGSPRPAGRQRLLPSGDPSPEPSHNEEGSRSDSHSNDELNNKADPDEDDGEPLPAKRKRLSLSYNGPTYKKRKPHLQQSSTRHRKHCSKFYQHLPKSHSVLGQGSGVAAGSCVEGPLPSPAPSAPKAMDKVMSSDCIDISRSSRNILPTLIEVTFRPQSPDCCSFTAVIPDGCDGRGVSFGRLARLVESTSHVGKIGDFTIQPIKQHSFLVTGFSRHASPRLSSGITLANAAKASPIHRDAIHIRHQTWQSRSCRGSCIARELAVQQR